MHEGDRNTCYFHIRAIHRFRRNRIDGLENLKGEKCVDEVGIASILVDFYQNLFTSSTLNQIDVTLEATPKVVMKEMNQELVETFVRVEVDAALQQMDPLKSPSPLFF